MVKSSAKKGQKPAANKQNTSVQEYTGKVSIEDFKAVLESLPLESKLDKSKVADALGVSRVTLYNFLKKQNIEGKDPWEFAKEYHTECLMAELRPLFVESLRVIRNKLREDSLEAAKYMFDKFGYTIGFDNKQTIDHAGGVRIYQFSEAFAPKDGEDG